MLATGFHDPEGLLFCARNLAQVHAADYSLELLRRAVEGGFHCPRAMVQDPWFDPVRARPEFVHLLHQAEARSAEAEAAFARAGGERLLGVG